jgi:hypothetical protein
MTQASGCEEVSSDEQRQKGTLIIVRNHSQHAAEEVVCEKDSGREGYEGMIGADECTSNTYSTTTAAAAAATAAADAHDSRRHALCGLLCNLLLPAWLQVVREHYLRDDIW